jgi:hypothetical protein
MDQTADLIPDAAVAEFLDLAKSAHIYFDIINGRLTMRAVNPNWEIWRPCRHLLDEIGSARIAAFLAHQPQARLQ